MADTRRVYIDTCSLIDLVKVEIGSEVNPDRANDVWHLKKLMEAHRDARLDDRLEAIIRRMLDRFP